VNHRALAYLLGQWTALRPATQRAVLEAEDRGCITNAYYFIDVDTSIAREMRDCFRRRAVRDSGCVVLSCAYCRSPAPD
jgi:hypothetical protein